MNNYKTYQNTEVKTYTKYSPEILSRMLNDYGYELKRMEKRPAYLSMQYGWYSGKPTETYKLVPLRLYGNEEELRIWTYYNNGREDQSEEDRYKTVEIYLTKMCDEYYLERYIVEDHKLITPKEDKADNEGRVLTLISKMLWTIAMAKADLYKANINDIEPLEVI